MGYLRCQCEGGDVPHAGAALHLAKGYAFVDDGASRHVPRHRRCTRPATVKLRRIVSTEGKPIDSAFFDYCEPCAKAIEEYQGSDVERKGGAR